MNASKNNHVVIFDTTLRDGEQSPGCSMSVARKLRLARSLAELGVDVIEAGFAAASQQDFDAVRQIAELVDGTRSAPWRAAIRAILTWPPGPWRRQA